MPKPIQARGPIDALRSLYGITGHMGGQLLDDVLPVHPVPWTADLEIQRGVHHWFAGQLAGAGGAGVYNYFAIFNPIGSNSLVVLERIGTGAAQTIMINPLAASKGSGFFYNAMDLRENGVPRAQVQFNSEAVAPVGVQIFTGPDPIDFLYVMIPGTGIFVKDQQANHAINLWCSWYERVASPEELVVGSHS